MTENNIKMTIIIILIMRYKNNNTMIKYTKWWQDMIAKKWTYPKTCMFLNGVYLNLWVFVLQSFSCWLKQHYHKTTAVCNLPNHQSHDKCLFSMAHRTPTFLVSKICRKCSFILSVIWYRTFGTSFNLSDISNFHACLICDIRFIVE